MRTGDEAAARARRSTARSSADAFDKVTYNLLDAARHARQVRRRSRTATSSFKFQPGRGAGAARVRDAAGARGAEDAVGEVPVHAEGADPDRDLPEARRLRRAQRSGCPGMIGALGACFGRVVTHGLAAGARARHVPLGGDALARAGARHHAADVEPAHAALADRRHLGLRGEAGAARVGPRDGGAVRAGDGAAARSLKLQGSERRLHQARDDRARLLRGLAARRSHRRDLRRGGAAAAAAARTATGIEAEAAIQKGARRHRSTSCRHRSTRRSTRGSRRCARALRDQPQAGATRRGRQPRCDVAAAAPSPAAIARSWRSGRRSPSRATRRRSSRSSRRPRWSRSRSATRARTR